MSLRLRSISCFAIVITVLSCLFGCDGGPGETADYSDRYLYAKINSVLYRINVDSASVSPVCPDPLCGHSDPDCPFFDTEEITMSGKYLYYLKNSSRDLCRFDLISGKQSMLYTADGGSIKNLFVSADHAFFNIVRIDSDFKMEYEIARYDLKSGKTAVLSADPLSYQVQAICLENGRIFWHGENGYYSTDTDYRDRINDDRAYSENLSYDNYSYTYEPTGTIIGPEGYKTMGLKCVRIDRETGEKVTVFENAACFPVLYRKKLVYCKLDEPRYLGMIYDESAEEWKKHCDKYGGKFYVCDGDGQNERLLCDISEELIAYPGFSGTAGNKNGVDEWICVTVDDYKKLDGDRIVRSANAFLLINIETGEYTVARTESNDRT